jgi:hypothetical protein
MPRRPDTAYVILGRKACLWCGFRSAHVRQRSGGHPYVYCPDCGLKTGASNGQQARLLTRNMRPEGGAGAPVVPSSSSDILVPKISLERQPIATWLDQLLKATTHVREHPGSHHR